MHWLAEIFRCVCAWCPVCGWEAFPHEAAPGFRCPDCGAAVLPPRLITEPVRPRLLQRGTPDLADQVSNARTRHDNPDLWDFNRLFVCSIKSAGIRADVPHWVRSCEVWGCIAVDSSRYREWVSDERGPYLGYVLFAPGFWREAWSLARNMAASHPERPAVYFTDRLAFGVFIFPGEKHRVFNASNLREF
jgi:hypothetical protein